MLSLHLRTETDNSADGVNKMRMLYEITPGEVKDNHYGIDLARAIGFTPRVIEVAENVSCSLRDLAAERQRSSEARMVIRRRKFVTQLRNALETAYSSNMDDGALRSYLRKLQVDFVRNMADLEPVDVDADASEPSAMANSPNQLEDQSESGMDDNGVVDPEVNADGQIDGAESGDFLEEDGYEDEAMGE